MDVDKCIGMKFQKHRGIGHIIAAIVIIVLILAIVYLIVGAYNSYTMAHTFISGTFQGVSQVTYSGVFGSGEKYIVELSGVTLNCNSASMGTGDIFTLTHLTIGQNVTMSEACTSIVVH